MIIFFFGFFLKIEFSRSLYKKKRNFDYKHLTCFEAYTKNIKNKKAWFSTQSNIIYFKKKGSMINKFTHKIKTVYLKFNAQFTYYGYISNNYINFSNIFTYLDRAWWVEQIDIYMILLPRFYKGINVNNYFNFQIQFCV